MWKRLCGLAMMLMVVVSLCACTTSSSDSSAATDLSAGSESTSTLMEIASVSCTEQTYPELEGQTLRDSTQLPSGELYLMTTDDQSLPHVFSSADYGSTWTEEDNSAAVQWMQENKVYNRQYYYDATGTWWAVNGDSVIRIAADGSAQEVDLPLFEAENRYVGIYGFADSGDGTVCFAAYKSVNKDGADPDGVWYLVDSNSGAVLCTIQIPYTIDYEPVFWQGDLVFMDYVGGTLNRYDPQNGQLLESVPIERPESLPATASITKDGVYSYLLRGTGLYRRSMDGSFTQVVTTDSTLLCFSPQFRAVGAFYNQADESYLIVGNTLDGAIKVYLLAMVTGAQPAQPEKTLQVWALQDSSLLQAVLQQYKAAYPDVGVNVTIGFNESDTAMTKDDAIRQLNTALLTDQAPDVLVLDELSVSDLIAQDMLADLSDLVFEGDHYQNILTAYKGVGDNSEAIYAYPAFFHIPTLAIAGDLVPEEVNSLSGLSELFNDGRCTAGSWKEIFDAVYPACSVEIFPDGKSLDETKLSDFFEQTLRMITAAGLEVESNPMSIGQGLQSVSTETPQSRYAMQNQQTDSAIMDLRQMSTATSLVTSHADLQLVPFLGGCFEPTFSLGVTAQSKDLDTAKEFVRFVLDNDSIQQNNVYGGWSVKKGVELAALSTMLENNYQDEERAAFQQDPLQFDWDAFISQCNTPVLVDGTGQLEAIVYEQAKAVYQGSSTIDNAVQSVAGQVALYLQERA